MEFWRDKKGNDIPLEDLEDDHLYNILIMMKARKEKDMTFVHLCQEARRRKLQW